MVAAAALEHSSPDDDTREEPEGGAMADQPNDIPAQRIEATRRDIRGEVERTIEERIERYLEIGYQRVIAGGHFAEASAECIRLYRDGYFLSAVMVSQALGEALWRFLRCDI